MPGYATFLALHIAAGTVALACFWLAAMLRKGSPIHRLAGRIYLLAMVLVIVTGVALTVQFVLDGHTVSAAFLGYLLLLVSTTVWLSWRAIRDRAAPARYLGRAYQVLAIANPAVGVAILWLGLDRGQPLLAGFSLVGILIGLDMLRRRRIIPTQPLWWLEEHYGAMVANGAATHIAFVAIGLPRLVPALQGSTWYYLGWFGPVVLSVVAKVWLDRRYRVRAGSRGPQPAYRRAPAPRPSPVQCNPTIQVRSRPGS